MVANLERVVRPFAKRDTRPGAVLPARPEDEEDSNIATINGDGGSLINLAHTGSVSFSRQRDKETERTFDTLRVTNPEDASQYVDVEAITKLKSRDGLGINRRMILAKPQATSNISIIREDEVRKAP